MRVDEPIIVGVGGGVEKEHFGEISRFSSYRKHTNAAPSPVQILREYKPVSGNIPPGKFMEVHICNGLVKIVMRGDEGVIPKPCSPVLYRLGIRSQSHCNSVTGSSCLAPPTPSERLVNLRIKWGMAPPY
eukprot:sb/3475208/